MFNQFDSCRVYHLDPQRQEDQAKDWSSVAWVQLAPHYHHLRADQLSHLFTKFGDFSIFKDSLTSFYLEFYYIEESKVPSQSIEGLIRAVSEEKEQLGVEVIVPYAEAVKFKAHDRINY